MAPPSPKARLLTSLAALLFLTAGLAGCLGSDDGDVLGTFYPMTFLAQEIAGDAVTVDQIIPSGMEPHDWEPGVRDLTRLSQSQLVVAQGLEFEPWLQPLINNLEDRAPPVVHSGDRLPEIPELDHDEDDHGHEDDSPHAIGVEGLEIFLRNTENRLMYLDGDHWHGNLPDLEIGEKVGLDAHFENSDGHPIPIGDGTGHEIQARLAADATAGLITIHNHSDHIDLEAHEEGTTRIVFELWHDDHVDWTSPATTVRVGETDDDGHDGSGDDGHSDGPPEVNGLRIIDRAQSREAAEVHGNHWHGGLPPVLVGDHVSLGAVFIDHNRHEIHLDEEKGFSLGARLAAGAEEEIVDFDFHRHHLHLHGLALGEVRIVFQLIHDDHVEWEAPPLRARVVDELDDHGHGPVDPHTWLDPVLFIEQARAVRDAMIQAFPEHEDTFRANAAALIDRLDAVHAAYRDRILNANCGTRNVIVQHNAFAYLGQRYDFEIHSVVGLSPQAEPNAWAVANAVDLALEHELSIVFTETLANPTVMNAVAQDATAKGTTVEVRVLSPLERRAPQESEADLDFIDIMYNNLDNLTDAMRCTAT